MNFRIIGLSLAVSFPHAVAFENLLSTSSTAALAVLHWVMTRLNQNDALLHQQERMAALGTYSAGLAQELKVGGTRRNF